MVHNLSKNSKALRRRERERLKKRDEIKEIAAKIFAKKGFYKTKMTDISRAMDYSVGFIYELFQSKEDLYLEVVMDKMTEFKRALKKSLEEPTAEKKLEKFIENYFKFFQKEKDFFRIYMQEHITFGKKRGIMLREKLLPEFKECFGYLLKVVEEGVREGSFKKGNTLIAAAVILGALHFLVYFWITGFLNMNFEVLKKESTEKLKSVVLK